VDGAVGEAFGPERVDLRLPDRRGLVRQADGELAERVEPRLEARAAEVVRDMCGELVGGALGTEVVCMRNRSVVAVVRAGDDDREQLAVGP
jgi:hypothetical protein